MDDNTFEQGGWGAKIRKNASSVLLPIIALLVLAGGVYFYTRGRDRSEQPAVEFQGTTTPTASVTSSPSPQISLKPSASPRPSATVTPPPPVKVESGAFKVRAGRGEGVTHMARRATQEYLAKNNPDYTVSKEHKIYVEDYLKRKAVTERSGNKSVSPDQEIAFSEAAIKEALASAQKLSGTQLERLKVYSARVPQL